MPLEPGQSLAHYRIVEKIGEGGMGEVYRAEDTKLGREVALKVLPGELARDEDRLARFRREARTLASLAHPNIAAIHGFEEADGIRFLALELVPGRGLDQRIAGGPLPLEEALRLAAQIAEGLEAAHERGIIHRDLKPANVKIAPDGRAKLLDFGLAKAAATDIPDADLSLSPTMTRRTAGMILGTAAYMSPEQARGRELDRRTDVWSFGCVLYEMLAGRGAFQAPTVSDCIAGILEREPDWSALPAATPASIRRLLRRCLQKDPRRRLHDAADARIEIEETLAGEEAAESAHTPPAASKGGPRLAWALAGAGLGILATLALTSREPAPESAQGRPAARFAVTLPAGAPVIPVPDTSSVAIAPDGRWLVYLGPNQSTATPDRLRRDEPSRRNQLLLRPIDGYEVVPLEGTAGANAPFFSPDGEWVGFVDYSDGRLKKVRLGGGAPVILCDASSNFRGASWGEDGRIYFASAVTGILAVSEDGGVPDELTRADIEAGEKTHRFPHILPGSEGLLFTLGSSEIASYDDAAVALLDLRSGERRVLFEGGTDPVYLPTGHILYGRRGTLETVPFDLESMQVTGPPVTVLEGVVTSDGYGSAHFAVSGTGTLIYVPGGPELYEFRLYRLGRDGGVQVLPLPSRAYGEVRFSPDGSRLALSILGANASIWVYEFEREMMMRLTTGWDSYSPGWKRDGETITYTSNRAGSEAIWQRAADGAGSPQELARPGGQVSYTGSWSAGDRSFVFSSIRPATGADIWICTPGDGGRLEPLFTTPFQEYEPVFSPDGRWLAYVSDATGRAEVYVQPFPVTGRKWQISAAGGESPLWSPDGRELYYWKGDRLMAVSLKMGAGLEPSRERELLQPEFSDLASWDISPDGDHFIVIGRTEGEPVKALSLSGARRNRVKASIPEIRVVVDWFQELRGGPP